VDRCLKCDCTMKSVTVHGLKIAYERAGDGPPLVLLHGFLADNRAWRPQIRGLAGLFMVIAWDTPGAERVAPVVTCATTSVVQRLRK
jgi:pimeloyl-ACP methyl ester carboxylesterase